MGPGCASNVGVKDSRKPILVVGDSVRRVAEDSERDKQSLRGGVEHSVRGESEDSVRAEQSVSGEDSERAEHSGGAEDSERAEHSGEQKTLREQMTLGGGRRLRESSAITLCEREIKRL